MAPWTRTSGHAELDDSDRLLDHDRPGRKSGPNLIAPEPPACRDRPTRRNDSAESSGPGRFGGIALTCCGFVGYSITSFRVANVVPDLKRTK
jgi:hypothetical protein